MTARKPHFFRYFFVKFSGFSPQPSGMIARLHRHPPFPSSPSFALTTPHTPSLLSAIPLTLSPTLSLPPFRSSLPFSPSPPLHFAMSQYLARVCHCPCQFMICTHARRSFVCVHNRARLCSHMTCPCASMLRAVQTVPDCECVMHRARRKNEV